MVMPVSGPTKAQEVLDRIRSEIVSGHLPPGQRLSPEEIRSRMGVSITVVREALTRLAADGEVHAERNRGFSVKKFSLQEIQDLTEVRKINECEALRLAVERRDVKWEAEVLAAHHVMSNIPMYIAGHEGRNPEWVQAHHAFNETLLGGCRNQSLLDVCKRLSNLAELYRGWLHVRISEEELEQSHREIRDAVLAHDGELAARLHAKHMDRMVEVLVRAGF